MTSEEALNYFKTGKTPEIMNIVKADDIIKQPDTAINAAGILQPVVAQEQKVATPDLIIPDLNTLPSSEQMQKIIDATNAIGDTDEMTVSVQTRFDIAKEVIPEITMGYTPEVINPIIDKVIEDSKSNIIAIHPEVTPEQITEMTGDSILELKQLSNAVTKEPEKSITELATNIVTENNQKVETALIKAGLKEAPVPAAAVKTNWIDKLITFIYNKLYSD